MIQQVLKSSGFVMLAYLLVGEASAKDWKSLQTEHFLVVGDAGDRALRRVGSNLEQFRSVVARLMPSLALEDGTDTTVIVFRNDGRFKPFKPIYNGKPANVGGYFQAGQYRNYIALTGRRDAERAIYHEYVHELTKGARHWPAWMREGIAEFYSTFDLHSGNRKVWIGKIVPEHVRELRRTFMPVEMLLNVDRNSPYYNESAKKGTFYAQSWALVHYLMIGNLERKGQLSRFSDLLEAGRDLEDSFETAFGTDMESMESELRSYIRNAVTWNAANYTLDERLADLKDVEVLDLPEALESFYKGDLLLHTRRFDDAQPYLEESIRLDPTLEAPMTSMFFLHERSGNIDLADEFLARAVRTENASYLPRLLYARRALSSGADNVDAEEAETQLRHVLDMRPNLLAPYLLLGQSLMRRPETLEEALSVLKTALARRPSEPRVALVYARALWVSGETTQARAIVAPIARNAVDPDVRNQAQVTLDQIERFGDIDRRAALRASPPTSGPGARPRIRRQDGNGDKGSGSTVVTEFNDTRVRPQGTKQIEGMLVLLDCSAGLRLRVVDGDTAMDFATTTPESLQFLSYSGSLSDSIKCGQVIPALPVRISYEPDRTASAPMLGTPVRIEFLAPEPRR